MNKELLKQLSMVLNVTLNINSILYLSVEDIKKTVLNA